MLTTVGPEVDDAVEFAERDDDEVRPGDAEVRHVEGAALDAPAGGWDVGEGTCAVGPLVVGGGAEGDVVADGFLGEGEEGDVALGGVGDGTELGLQDAVAEED